MDTVNRFTAKIDYDGPNGCWLWKGGTWRGGYGQFAPTRTTKIGAHRFAYELFIGPIPPGKVLDHLCRTPSCVNPYHLEPVTTRENILRGTGMAARNAFATQCKNGHPFDYIRGDGARCCRRCEREYKRAYRAAKREKAAA